MSNIFFPVFLSSILPRIPLYLVWIAAIIIAIVNWQKNPKVSLLTLIAVAGLLVVNLVG